MKSETWSGNIHAPAWTAILATIIASSMLSGCAGTYAAYKAADGPVETSKVVGEHYYATVRELDALKDAGSLVGSALLHVQDLARSSRPIVLELGNSAAAHMQEIADTLEAGGELADWEDITERINNVVDDFLDEPEPE